MAALDHDEAWDMEWDTASSSLEPWGSCSRRHGPLWYSRLSLPHYGFPGIRSARILAMGGSAHTHRAGAESKANLMAGELQCGG